MQGGPSQVDTYDPKPLLAKLNGQHPPDSFGNEDFQNGKLRDTVILGSKRTFKKYGQSGLEVSDLFPHTSQRVDDLAVDPLLLSRRLHALAGAVPDQQRLAAHRPPEPRFVDPLRPRHRESESAGFCRPAGGRRPLRSGGLRAGLPAGGLPGHVVPPGPQSDSQSQPPRACSPQQQRDLLDTLRTMNEQHLEARNHDSELAARIESYELAFRMQMSAPEATDVSSESEATKKLYGLDDPVSADFGGRCLLARRLVERGVRFVQVWNRQRHERRRLGWPHRSATRIIRRAPRKPTRRVAGLLTDLKSRGLLDSTLVIWGGEFGRSPVSDGGAGGVERPRPQSLRLHHLDGRRRRQGRQGDRLHRRTRPARRRRSAST